MRAQQTFQNKPTGHVKGITKLGLSHLPHHARIQGGGQGGLGPPSPQNIAPPNSEARAKRALPPPPGPRGPWPPLTKSWIRLCTLSHWGQASSRKRSECGRHGLSNILKLQATFLYSIYPQRAGKTNLFYKRGGRFHAGNTSCTFKPWFRVRWICKVALFTHFSFSCEFLQWGVSSMCLSCARRPYQETHKLDSLFDEFVHFFFQLP